MDRKLYLSIRAELKFKKRNLHLALGFLMDFTLLGLIFLSLKPNSFVALTSIPLIPVLLFRAFGLMHDAVHGSLHQHNLINNSAGFLYGIICLLPFYLWKKSHLQHHYWAGNYEKDPVLMIVRNFPTSSTRSKKLFIFFWQSKIPFAGFSQIIVFWILAFRHWLEKPTSVNAGLSFLLPLGIWVGIASQASAIQFVSMVLGLFLYFRLIEVVNFPHHVGIYSEKQGDHHLPHWEQHTVSRTCRYPSIVEKCIVMNFNFHSEHHMYPDLPWHQLPQAHQKILTAQTLTNQTYLLQVNHSWLQEKNQHSFEEFLFPDKPKAAA